METFEQYLQKECGNYPLRTIIDNLLDEQIEESVIEYSNLLNVQKIDNLLEKYKIKRKTIDDLLSVPEFDMDKNDMQTVSACKRFVVEFMNDLEQLK